MCECEARLAALERRLQTLEDVQQIQELQARYVRALGDREWETLLDCYARDAVCDVRLHGVLRGREQIAKLVLEELPAAVRTRDGYILSSPMIEVDGDRATGEFTWHRHVCEFQTAFGTMRVWGPWSEGRYRCEYVREDGAWKVSYVWFRVIRPDSDDELAPLSRGEVIGGLRP